MNRTALERRVARLSTFHPLDDLAVAAWLLRAITLTDLTSLSGDDTPGSVRQLCASALQPAKPALLDALGAGHLEVRTAAVCVYHRHVKTAVQALVGTGIPVAAVSAGFPAGLSPLHSRISEIRASLEEGAEEIDIVITRAHVLRCEWEALYDEVRTFREACGPALMKAILATGELGTPQNIARASLVCMMAGSDFIKTSTGKEAENATLSTGLTMARCIREYHVRTGNRVGLKPSGGLRIAAQALQWLILTAEELGTEWLQPRLLRFGASSLVDDITGRLSQYARSRTHELPQAPTL